MRKAFLHYFVQSLGVVAALIAIYGFYAESVTDLNSQGVVAVLFLGCFALYYFFVSLWRTSKWFRYRNYGSVLSLINEGLSEVRQVNRDIEDFRIEVEKPDQKTCTLQAEKIKKACELVCNKVSQAFSIITSTNSHVSIKVLVQSEDDEPLEVEDLCRSNKDRKYTNEVKHWLQSNTDFREVFENIGNEKGRYFMCNNLTKRIGYQNTSFQTYGEAHSSFKQGKWPLPYKSTIVAPIYSDSEEVLGFLCVDSSEIDAFRKEYDIELITGVANGLYDMVMNYIVWLNLSDESGDTN